VDDRDVHDPADGPTPLRVLVVDGDERVRESLAGLLSIGGKVEVVGVAGDPVRALELIPSVRPDVVVIDPRLPEPTLGVALIERLRREAPGVRVVVMRWTDVADVTLDECGADGFVRKTFRPSELLAAIQAACAPTPPTT
jgi:DNA-binding NarL/FixJ family response regulator